MIVYRYSPAGLRTAVDMGGLYHGADLFVVGGSPALRELPLELIEQPGIVTLALNNVPLAFPRPTMWLTADRPECFSADVYGRAELLKFACLSRREIEVPGTGRRAQDFPASYFYGTTDQTTPETFLEPGDDLCWWRSVFPIALQLAHRLGFARVFLVGCGFSMDPARPYAWDASLTADQAAYSHATYQADLGRLRALAPRFEAAQFDVVSCTPGSLAHEVLPYLPLAEAVAMARGRLPAPTPPRALVHSSRLQGRTPDQGPAPQPQPQPQPPPPPVTWQLTEDEAGLLSTVLALESRAQERLGELEREAVRERKDVRQAMVRWSRAVARGRGVDPAAVTLRLLSPTAVAVSTAKPLSAPPGKTTEQPKEGQ